MPLKSGWQKNPTSHYLKHPINETWWNEIKENWAKCNGGKNLNIFPLMFFMSRDPLQTKDKNTSCSQIHFQQGAQMKHIFHPLPIILHSGGSGAELLYQLSSGVGGTFLEPDARFSAFEMSEFIPSQTTPLDRKWRFKAIWDELTATVGRGWWGWEGRGRWGCE